MNYQYPGYTWRHLVDSDLSCHMVLGLTCRFLPHTVKSFYYSFHTNIMVGNHSCWCVMDSHMIHRSIPCLNLFNISRKTSPFLWSPCWQYNMVGHVNHIPRMHCLGDYCAIWCYTNRLSRVLRIAEASWIFFHQMYNYTHAIYISFKELYTKGYCQYLVIIHVCRQFFVIFKTLLNMFSS